MNTETTPTTSKTATPKGKNVPTTFCVESALQDAASEIAALSEEMRAWADSMEEKFSQTSKYEQVLDAADTLEGADFPTIVENLIAQIEEAESAGTIAGVLRGREFSVQVFQPYKGRRLSRASRRSEAVGKAREALAAAEEVVGDVQKELAKRVSALAGTEEEGALDSEESTLDELVGMFAELSSAIDDIEAVDFPSMYG